MNTYKTGIFAELVACVYLVMHGFRILQRRYITGRRTGRAEIDIIARRKNLLIFVEVKRRGDVITGLNAVTGAQSWRLRRAAETYIAQNHWAGDARFDIVVIAPHKIRWIRGAI
ncbi:MAG: YraN family protein [Proteobacteria bacterium]|uniref:YraN family protein n=1 Tax=Candidatus Enterousia excrementavium TaxID=2840789 RepID=A0A940DFE5_9PROT|nr:YraN family protein [Candidatus Enterousia excrementavium]